MNEKRAETARTLYRLRETRRAREDAMARAKEVTAEIVRLRFDALALALKAINDLPKLLAAYEETGDHDHSHLGNRPVAPGEFCPGGDCNVNRARRIIAALKGV